MTRIAAGAVAVALAVGAWSMGLTAQEAQNLQQVTLAGTATPNAVPPFSAYTVRARQVESLLTNYSAQARELASLVPAWTTHLDENGKFSLPNLSHARYLLELVDKDGRIVCSRGPYDMRDEVLKNDVVFDCSGTQQVTLAGTAKNEAKLPYTDFSVRARELESLLLTWSTPLNTDGNFVLPNLSHARYLVELVNKDNRVVCTEGPYDMRQEVLKNDVVIDCGSMPAAWWLLSAGSASGITAGITVTDASPSR